MTDNTTNGPAEPTEVGNPIPAADAALSDAVESVARVEGTTVPDDEAKPATEPTASEIDHDPVPVEANVEVSGPPVDAQVHVEAGGTDHPDAPQPAAGPAPDATQPADPQPAPEPDVALPDAVEPQPEPTVTDSVEPQPEPTVTDSVDVRTAEAEAVQTASNDSEPATVDASPEPTGAATTEHPTEQPTEQPTQLTAETSDGPGVAATVSTETGSPVEASAEVTPAPAIVPPSTETAVRSTPPATPTAPKPSAVPRPPVPTPAALAKVAPHPPAVVAPPTITTDHSASAAHGRVDEQGVVFVRTADGEEKEVGSYPGASSEQALTYFARKYDELFASALLLEQRLGQPEVPSKDVQEGLKALRAQTDDAAVVGDLDALASKLDEIQSGIAAKRVVEQQHRAEARAAAKVEREAIVVEAESIAGQPESRIQWKTSGARMRELLDDWKAHQRASTRLDRESETALWQRFSTARNGFDKARRTHFAGLDAAHSEAKSAKERLVDEAEKLATSTDWAPTAGAFKRLMDEWRRAGRASRSDDDKLWARFKAAQDAFFAAKDAVVAQEEEGFRGNLSVKEALLTEAQSILPVTDLEKAKGQLRAVQDKWDAAGKVPRADMERIEKALRRIEQTVRDADDKRWKSSNPEAAARAQGMVDQLEGAVADLEADLTKAEASGNASKIKKAKDALEARRAWLDQARAGVAEFGG